MYHDIKQRGRKSKKDLEIMYLYQTMHKSRYYLGQGCKSLLSIGGDNLQFYPNFALFSRLGGEPRPRFFSAEQINRRRKRKKVFTKNGTLFSPNSGKDLRSDTPVSNYWRECR